MKARHRRFEMQSVLASCGQLSGRELERLREHAASCEACQNHLREMDAVNLYLLTAMPDPCQSAPDSKPMTERFVTRAIREGVPLGEKPMSRPPMQLACALLTVILSAIVTAAVTWHPSRRTSHEMGIASAAQVSTGQSPLTVRGSRSGDRSKKLLHRPARRMMMRESFSSAESRNELTNHVQGDLAVLFTDDGRPNPHNASELAFAAIRNKRDEMPPGLAAWLARQNAAPALLSFTARRNCEARDESSSGDQPWWACGRRSASGPPAFCYDPRFALVADSKLPDSIRPRWDRYGELEGLPPFIINSDSRVVIH